MGYINYYLDDLEIIEDRKNNIVVPVKLEAKMIYFHCPYCTKTFETKNDLYHHIKNEHNIVHPIIIINNKILTNEKDYYIIDIEQVIIHFYGYKSELKIGNKDILFDQDDLDVTEYIKKELNRNNSCRVIIGMYEFNICKYSSQSINNPKINEIIKNWEISTSNNQSISKKYNENFNDAEQRYLNGFYDYFIACHSNGYEKAKRYEDAFYLLNSFNDIPAIGLCVLKIISYRLNWIHKLSELCTEDDDFKEVCNFYFNKNQNTDFKENENVNKFYVEDELRDCIDAILAYQRNDLDKVDNYLSAVFEKQQNSNDQNFKDRVLVLKVRRLVDKNLDRKARYYSKDIKSPFFEGEYERYTKFKGEIGNERRNK